MFLLNLYLLTFPLCVFYSSNLRLLESIKYYYYIILLVRAQKKNFIARGWRIINNQTQVYGNQCVRKYLYNYIVVLLLFLFFLYHHKLSSVH